MTNLPEPVREALAIKRYAPVFDNNDPAKELLFLAESPGGEWVKFSDVQAHIAALTQQAEALTARVAEQTAQLAQCFKIAGADSDGNEDWRIAPRAVQAVTDLRRDYDEACNEADTLRHAALAGAAPDDAAELEAWRELGRCVFLGLPTFPKKWPQDVSVIGYSLSMRHKAHAPAKAREVTEADVANDVEAIARKLGDGSVKRAWLMEAVHILRERAALATFAEGE